MDLASSRDGMSRKARALPALAPTYVSVEERTTADLLSFVGELAKQLRFFQPLPGSEALDASATWEAFANHPQLSPEDMAAFIQEPERFREELSRWLGRPHFALLLTFLELLRHAHGDMRKLTERHLDFYYRDILRLAAAPAEPDRVMVSFALAPGAREARLPAGTELAAGRDSAGQDLVYRTERELLVGRAQVAEVRSLRVQRRITELSGPRERMNSEEAFQAELALALGKPRPGDAIPKWKRDEEELPVNAALFRENVAATLKEIQEQLRLRPDELRKLVRLKRRRGDSDSNREWQAINDRLGPLLPDKAEPELKKFEANVDARVGSRDLATLSGIDTLEELYAARTEPKARELIEDWFVSEAKNRTFDDFEALMAIKLRIDAEWQEINQLLEQIGRGLRENEAQGGSWPPQRSTDFDPTDFEANLRAALGTGHPWLSDAANGETPATRLEALDEKLGSLEEALSMPALHLQKVVDFLERIDKVSASDWLQLDDILARAHRESVHAAARKALDERPAEGSVGEERLLTLMESVALPRSGAGGESSERWQRARALFAELLPPAQLTVLDFYREWLVDDTAARRFEWPDVLRVLELAERIAEGRPESRPRKVEWQNLFAHQDARAELPEPGESPRWRPFGIGERAQGETTAAATAPTHSLGFALSSPTLALGSGTRTVTVRLHCAASGFEVLESELGTQPLGSERDTRQLADKLADALQVDLSTEAGWVGPAAPPNWELTGEPTGEAPDKQQTLTLTLTMGPQEPALAPLAPMAEAALRVRLKHQKHHLNPDGIWITRYAAFEALRLKSAELKVEVEGLGDVQLQADERPLDGNQPFQPFGSQPMEGSRFHLGHPELERAGLSQLTLAPQWAGVPPDELRQHYKNYGAEAADLFKAKLLMVHGSGDSLLETEHSLFESINSRDSSAELVANVEPAPTVPSQPSPAPSAARDVRKRARYFSLELLGDCGHGTFPALAAKKARQLAIALATTKTFTEATSIEDTAATYEVRPPYTPTLKALQVGYQASAQLEPAEGSSTPLLHIHPFGQQAVGIKSPRLFPRYEAAGELYIGLEGTEPPRNVSLLLQVAEGTSDPDAEAGPLRWSCLDGDVWRDLGDEGRVLVDATRGLLNTGIVELSLPAVAPSRLLPEGLYWLRASVESSVRGVCDLVEIRTQATSAVLASHNAAPDHFERPLPAGSIRQLVRRDARIATVDQPYTSFGGRPSESPELFRSRVSERLRHKQRALSPWDYERLVLQRFPNIYKAKCLTASFRGRAGSVVVVVVPDIRQALPSDAYAPKVSADQLASITEYLTERAPKGASIVVKNPEFVPVRISLAARFRAGVDEGFAIQQLKLDLKRFLSPWAYEQATELTIGGKIFEASVLQFADELDYVDYVANVELEAEGNPNAAESGFVQTTQPNQVLVSGREHTVYPVSALGYDARSFTGINYMKIETNFIVG